MNVRTSREFRDRKMIFMYRRRHYYQLRPRLLGKIQINPKQNHATHYPTDLILENNAARTFVRTLYHITILSCAMIINSYCLAVTIKTCNSVGYEFQIKIIRITILRAM